MVATTEDPDDLKRQVEYLDTHYRRLVESISEGISVVTLDGIVASLSPAFESLTGWTTSQLIGSYVQSLVHPVDLPLTIERLQRLNNGEQLPPGKLRLLQSSGEYRLVEVVGQPEIEAGKVKNVWVLVRDLSKDEQLAKQQEELSQEQRGVQLLYDLIRAATTRARDPLTRVNLVAYWLTRQISEPAAFSSANVIELQVQHLVSLLERVLAMAELDANRAHFAFGPVHLNRVLHYLETTISSLAEARKITLTLKPADTLPPVRADEQQLYRAVQEVVENALEYTPENGTVTVSTFRKETYGVLEVQDTGIGIAADLMPHLFERFYHFNLPPSAPEKLGLGLPIAKKILEQHDGTISVESAPGKGSTFTIAVPLYTP
ncbi:MAG: PAS domain S-box protein [Chloroflexi bacterium]|nr:PAS domain S-box protein [Chloroflexota bacterium]MDL1885393.1 PAS domain S-box protein [Anaerolineae bacterium CFX8]